MKPPPLKRFIRSLASVSNHGQEQGVWPCHPLMLCIGFWVSFFLDAVDEQSPWGGVLFLAQPCDPQKFYHFFPCAVDVHVSCSRPSDNNTSKAQGILEHSTKLLVAHSILLKSICLDMVDDDWNSGLAISRHCLFSIFNVATLLLIHVVFRSICSVTSETTPVIPGLIKYQIQTLFSDQFAWLLPGLPRFFRD